MSVAENRLNLGRRRCNDLRRHLAGLEALAQRLRADERRLRAELQLALQPAVAGAPVGNLPESLAERHGKLARSVAEIDSQIATVGAALGVAERELKRHERASAQHAAGAVVPERRGVHRSSRVPGTSPIAGPRRRS
jgi:hypothetical protein